MIRRTRSRSPGARAWRLAVRGAIPAPSPPRRGPGRTDPVEVQGSLVMPRPIQAGHGLTLIFIEHNVRALMALSCSRIVVLHHGERIAVGAPGEMGRDDEEIAAYLGEAR